MRSDRYKLLLFSGTLKCEDDVKKCLFKVDEKGDHTGENITYIYPGKFRYLHFFSQIINLSIKTFLSEIINFSL